MKYLLTIILFLTFIYIDPAFGMGSKLDIHLSESNELYATYKFDKKRSKLTFPDTGKTTRRKSWRIMTPCVDFDGLVIKASADCDEFDEIELKILTTDLIVNREYPSSIQFNSDRQIGVNLSYFGSTGEVEKVNINAGEDRYVYSRGMLYGKSLSIDAESISQKAEYVYIGIKPVILNKMDIMMDEGLPEWIASTLRNNTNKIIEFYEKKLNVTLEKKTFLMASYYPDSENSKFWGDVDSNGAISLRFYGEKWLAPDDKARESILKFVAHEIFHLFNGFQFESQSSASEPWLHEGSAEAASISALYYLGHLSYEIAVNHVLEKWKSCYDYHSMKSGNRKSDRFLINKLNYGCGTVVSFNYNYRPEIGNSQKKISNFIDMNSVFTTWNNIFRNNTDRSYSEEDFYLERKYSLDRGKFDFGGLVDSQFNPKNPVLTALDHLGVKYSLNVTSRNISDLASGIVKSILRINCGGYSGYWVHSNYFKIEFRKGCIGFNKNFVVSKVNGKSLFSGLDSLKEIVQMECKSLILSNDISEDRITLKCPDRWPSLNRYSSLSFSKQNLSSFHPIEKTSKK